MIKMKTSVLLVCISLIVSCTSTPLNMRYYSLHTANKIEPLVNTPELIHIVIEPIKIAGYLQQASLVMQINSHELYYSPQDVWAEELSNTFYKALLQDLNSSQQYNFIGRFSPIKNKANINISIELEHFHSTHSSIVVSSGQYTVLNNSDNKQNINITSFSKPFYFELGLTDNGYLHSVTQLRKLISLIAKQINHDLVNNKLN